MQKIKRTRVRSVGGGRFLLRFLLILLICGLLIVGGYIAAYYWSRYFMS